MKYHKLSSLRIIIACEEAPLGRILSHTLSSLGAEVEWVTSHKALIRRTLYGEWDVVVTRFVAPLLASRRVVAQLRTSHSYSSRRALYVIAEGLSAEESVALLERGVCQLLTLPISTTRLTRKISLELTKTNRQCSSGTL